MCVRASVRECVWVRVSLQTVRLVYDRHEGNEKQSLQRSDGYRRGWRKRWGSAARWRRNEERFIKNGVRLCTVQGERHFHGDWTWAPRSWNNTSGRCPRNVPNAHSLELCLLRNWHKRRRRGMAVAYGGRGTVFFFFLIRQKKIFLFLILESSCTRAQTYTHTHTWQSHKRHTLVREIKIHTSQIFELNSRRHYNIQIHNINNIILLVITLNRIKIWEIRVAIV